MKRAPWILALFVTVVLGYCVLNDMFWPLKASPDWHPAWWQCRSLSGIGLLISLPGGILVSAIRDAGVKSEMLLSVYFTAFVIITVALVAAAVWGTLAWIRFAVGAKKLK
jgi:hypothetical protein